MKKRINRKYVAKGLAVALVLGGIFTTPLSGNSGTFSMFFGNPALEAQAEESNSIVIDSSYLDISGDTINGFIKDYDSETDSWINKDFMDLVKSKNSSVVNVSFADDVIATEIAKEAFDWDFNVDGIEFKLTLPKHVEKIGEKAFMNNKISSINFGSSIRQIERKAFYRAGLNTDLVLPEGLEQLDDMCFFQNKIIKVNFPGSLTTVGDQVFAVNAISEIDFTHYNVRGNLENSAIGNVTNQIIIPTGIFHDNNLTHLDIPKNVVAIGGVAFAGNKLQKLTIPKNVEKIYPTAFSSNHIRDLPENYNPETDDPEDFYPVKEYTIKELVFETDDAGHGVKEVAGDAFSASIDGIINLPNTIEYIDGDAFKDNKITKVLFNSAPFIGIGAFMSNPLETIENLNSRELEEKAFQDIEWKNPPKTLKNVSFNYGGLNPNFNHLPKHTFPGELLKSINLPAQITNIDSEAFGSILDYGRDKISFLNPGWYNDNNKVALYRVGTDGKTYVTNGDLADGNYYVVNPVLFKFDLKDQYGNPLPVASLPQNIKAEITRNGVTTTYTDISVIDSTHFKLGDKVKFTLPATPTGYDFIGVAEQTGLTKISDTEYEVSLDPAAANVVKDAAYDDSYKVGYKTAVIELRYRSQSSGPVVPTPEPTPNVPSTPSTPAPSTPDNSSANVETPVAPQDNQATTDIDDNNTPQGAADADTTDIDDDTTPQGKADAGKKVKADKTTETVIDEDTTPKGTAPLPKTGGANENIFIILGTALIGLAITLKKKFR